MNERPVSILCAHRNSIYTRVPGTIIYDAARDARTFDFSTPIVAHPPCRSWSAHCAHQAKPAEGERELAIWIADVLKQVGGILEHPAHSRLHQAAGLPLPSPRIENPDCFTISVKQAWWGMNISKNTWLTFSRIPLEKIVFPYVLHDPRHDVRKWNSLSSRKRAASTYEFAAWAVVTARVVYEARTGASYR